MLYRELSAPLTSQIEVTTECNNRCPHCYNSWRQTDEADFTLTLDQTERIMAEIISAGVFRVVITGGEPLLQPDLVVKIVRSCAEAGIQCSINSNLALMNDTVLDRIISAGPVSFLTSIASSDPSNHDGHMGRKGAFVETIKGIAVLRERGISFGANMVVTQRNANQVYETGCYVRELGARAFTATKASPPMGCPDYSKIRPTPEQVRGSLDDLLRLKGEGFLVDALECYPLCFLEDLSKYEAFTRRNCSAGVTSASVGANGMVRPCPHSVRTYGNVLEESLVTIFGRMTEWRTGELLPSTCLECQHLPRCSGGCRCEAEYYGVITDMDPLASVPESVRKVDVKAPNPVVVSDNDLVQVRPMVKHRLESFGSVLVIGTKTILIDEDASKMVAMISDRPMKVWDLADKTGCDMQKCYQVIQRLLGDGFLVRIGRKEVKQ